MKIGFDLNNGVLYYAVTVLRFLLALFFVVMAVRNLAGDSTIAADFARWGYPPLFRKFTAVLQLLGGLMLLVEFSTFYGAAVLTVVMVGAAATHLKHDPPAAALSALVFLVMTLALAAAFRPAVINSRNGMAARSGAAIPTK